MRTALILARKHGAKTFSVVSGPEVGVAQQRDKFKDFARLDHHPDLAEYQLWESDIGIAKKCRKPAKASAPVVLPPAPVAADAESKPEKPAKKTK